MIWTRRLLLNALRPFEALAGDRRGVTAVLTGLSLTLLFGCAGIATDIANWLNATRGMQAAADQAAYSAALAAGTNGCSSTTATTQATGVAAARGYTNGVNNTTVRITCSSSTSQFTIKISQKQPMWFANLFLRTAPTAAAKATAQLASRVSDVCVLALDGTNVAAAQIGSDADITSLGGNTTLNLHCGIGVDSSSLQAFAVGGSASVTATDIYIVGDDQGSPSGSASLTTSPTANNILKYQPPIVDPYLDRTVPTLTSCDHSNYAPPGGSTLNPGVYCGGLTLGSSGGGHGDTYTLNPGVYYIAGSTLTINASANVTANGVTFVLTGGTIAGTTYSYATAKINGGSTLSLTATNATLTPTVSSNFYGLAIFQDRAAPFASNSTCGNGNAQNKLNGGSGQLITGALYFPNQSVCFTGNSSTTGAGQCTQLIARTLDFTGTSSVQLSCSGSGVAWITQPTPQLIR